MQFLDHVSIEVISGHGWNGVVSARRESGVPFGGPSGGNGGRGWSVILRASKDENTLLAFKYIKNYKAKAGEAGRSKDQFGANAEDLYVTVPVGTIVKNKKTGAILHHFTQHQEERTAAEGWEGGHGNMVFKDSVHQYPNFATLGEPGHTKDLALELQLLADVALIGTPSVGKSSIINTLAATKAKVADYAFTTLVPHIGSIEVHGKRFNMMDVPGLIAWAAEWKWLGNEFLRHILKSKVLAFVVDASRYETGMSDITVLMDELITYIKQRFGASEYIGDDTKDIIVDIVPDDQAETIKLIVSTKKGKTKEPVMTKLLHIVINKYDLVNDDEILSEYKHALRIIIKKYVKKQSKATLTDNVLFHTTFVISAATHHGMDAWMHSLAHTMELATDIPFTYIPISPEEEVQSFVKDVTEATIPYLIEQRYIEEIDARFCKVRYVADPDITKMVFTTMWWNDEAEMHFWKVMESRWSLQLLQDFGIRKWDILRVKSFYEGLDDKFIQY